MRATSLLVVLVLASCLVSSFALSHNKARRARLHKRHKVEPHVGAQKRSVAQLAQERKDAAKSEHGTTEGDITEDAKILEAEEDADATEPEEAVSCEFRVRKEWRELTHEERLHFFDAINELRKIQLTPRDTKTVYESFVDKYEKNYPAVHGNSWFLPWNRAFILQFENALQSTETGKKHCVTLPYWDTTREFHNRTGLAEIFSPEYFGLLNDECIEEGPLAGLKDPTIDGECVRRHPSPRFHFTGPAQIQKYMADYINYGSHGHGFRRGIESFPTAMPRLHVGGVAATARAVADPVVWLLLTSTDMWWSTWQKCRGYDVVDSKAINEIIYLASDDSTKLDNVMPGFKGFTARHAHSVDDLGYGYAIDQFLLDADFDVICNWGEAEIVGDSDSDGVDSDADDAIASSSGSDGSDSDSDSAAVDADADELVHIGDDDASTGAPEVDGDDSDSDGSESGSGFTGFDSDSDSDSDSDDSEGYSFLQTYARSQGHGAPIDPLTVVNMCFHHNHNGPEANNNDADSLREAVFCECKIVGDHATWTKEWFDLNQMSADYTTGADESDYCKAYEKDLREEDEDEAADIRQKVTITRIPEPFNPTIVPTATIG